jgi:hypothetical protein
VFLHRHGENVGEIFFHQQRPEFVESL